MRWLLSTSCSKYWIEVLVNIKFNTCYKPLPAKTGVTHTAGGLAQVLVHLPNKQEAQNLNLSTAEWMNTIWGWGSSLSGSVPA